MTSAAEVGRSCDGVEHDADRSAQEGTNVWIIAGHEIVDAAERDAYVSAHADLVRRARQAPGCLDVAITADPVDPRRINDYERWESWDAIEAWRAVAAAPDTGIEVSSGEVMAYRIAAVRSPF